MIKAYSLHIVLVIDISIQSVFSSNCEITSFSADRWRHPIVHQMPTMVHKQQAHYSQYQHLHQHQPLPPPYDEGFECQHTVPLTLLHQQIDIDKQTHEEIQMNRLDSTEEHAERQRIREIFNWVSY